MKDAFRFLVVALAMDCPIGYHIICHYTKLALVQATVGDKGTRFPLMPSTFCLNAISRKKEVKSKGINLVVAEAIVVICGHIPHTSLIQAEERNFPLSTETMSSDDCTRLNNTLATVVGTLESFHLQDFCSISYLSNFTQLATSTRI